MIQLGAELTKELDRGGWPVVASFWLYDAEINQWKLVLASPVVEEHGPRAGYRRVSRRWMPSTRPSRWVVSPSSPPAIPIVHALASSAYARGESVEARRVSRTMVNREFVDDAYLYRLMPIAPAA